MILIDPFPLVRRQQFHIKQLLAQGRHGNVLETQPWFVSEFVRGADFLGHDDILDADAEVVVFVVAGF